MKINEIFGKPVNVSLPSVRTRNPEAVRAAVREAVREVATGPRRGGKRAVSKSDLPPEYVENRLIVRFKPDVLQATMRVRGGAARPTVLEDRSDHTALLERVRASTGVKKVKPLFADATASRSTANLASLRHTMAVSALTTEAAPDRDTVGWNVLEFRDQEGLASAKRLLERNNELVEVVERVPTRWLAKIRTPSPNTNRQWGLRAIGFFDAQLASAAQVPVAVVDSGIDMSNPLLGNAVIKSYNYFKWVPEDLEQHGTHVAGTIAALVDDALGVSGLADTPIHAWKVIDDKQDKKGYRYVSFDEYARALAEVGTSGARVLNLSLGGTASSKTEQILFKRLADAGVFVVAAMGNEYEDGNPTEYPAAYSGVHGVCAVDEVGRRAYFSNTGKHAFISAPGVNVLSTMPTADNEPPFGCLDGTSMATPHVAAAAALVLAKFPDLTVPELGAVLRGTAALAQGQKPETRSHSFGYGLLRIDLALQKSRVDKLRKQANS